MVTTLLEPGGHLPGHRMDDLERFLYAVLSAGLRADGDLAGLVQKLERQFRRAPIEENAPLLFEVIARHARPRPDDR
jgi:hypothetical protein